MGICFSKNFRKVHDPDSNTLKYDFLANRKNIIEKIHEFHKLTRNCKFGYEICIQENRRDAAAVLKKKKKYINSILKKLRESVKKTDDAMESGIEGHQKIMILDEIQKICKEWEKELLVDNVNEIVHGEESANYCKNVNELIERSGLNYNIGEIYSAIDDEIERNKICSHGAKRRRYNRALSHNSV